MWKYSFQVLIEVLYLHGHKKSQLLEYLSNWWTRWGAWTSFGLVCVPPTTNRQPRRSPTPTVDQYGVTPSYWPQYPIYWKTMWLRYGIPFSVLLCCICSVFYFIIFGTSNFYERGDHGYIVIFVMSHANSKGKQKRVLFKSQQTNVFLFIIIIS